MSKLGELRMALLCSALFILCVVASQPRLEMGLNDDWAYIWSARQLAQTGHIAYNGWETTMLGWQLYLGASFIKAFGFSFFTIRASTLLISVGTCILLQRLFVRLGISEWNSTVGTLMVVLSPIFLLLGYSFMSDVPGLFVLLVAIYGCVRAIQSELEWRSAAWLAFSALSNAVGGSARQIAWLGVLIVVPCAIWLVRRRKIVATTGICAWIVSCGIMLLLVRWFKNQPYTISEPLLLKSVAMPHYIQPGINLVRTFLAICLLVLPLLSAFLVRYPRQLKRRRDLALLGGIAVAALFMFVMRHRSVFELLPFGTHYMTSRGVVFPGVLGSQPLIFNAPLRTGITMLILSSLFCFLAVLTRMGQLSATMPVSKNLVFNLLDSTQLLVLLGPLAFASVALLVTRSAPFDRYYLSILVLFSILLLWVFESTGSGRLPPLSVAMVALFALYAVASTHDIFALARARVMAADEIRAAGVPRSQIRAGFEYDGTTELELTGYVNESRITKPHDAYRPSIQPEYSNQCTPWFSDRTPSIKARYVLSHDDACFKTSKFAPVPYRTWLPWREQQILIREIP